MVYGTEDLAAMGLHPARHTTRVSADTAGNAPVTLELSDTPDRES
ncbi:hypothetical protein [Streptomyces sp. TE33382]